METKSAARSLVSHVWSCLRDLISMISLLLSPVRRRAFSLDVTLVDAERCFRRVSNHTHTYIIMLYKCAIMPRDSCAVMKETESVGDTPLLLLVPFPFDVLELLTDCVLAPLAVTAVFVV
jgi:hypothetical protein